MKMIMETSLNTNILEYIVPIRFRSKLLGTGIIHKSLLITAAHVVEELEKEKNRILFRVSSPTFCHELELQIILRV